MKLKKLGLISILIGATLGLTGCNKHKVGDLLYNGRFEIISIIDSSDSMYEVRDVEEGVHYFVDTYTDALSPVFKNDGKVKVTEKNEKYVDKNSSNNENAESNNEKNENNN